MNIKIVIIFATFDKLDEDKYKTLIGLLIIILSLDKLGIYFISSSVRNHGLLAFSFDLYCGKSPESLLQMVWLSSSFPKLLGNDLMWSFFN